MTTSQPRLSSSSSSDSCCRARGRCAPSTQPDERRTAAAVLVIGTGAAGLRAAIELAESGVQVLCVGKRRRDDAHTVLASGGISAALATMDPEDSWEQHAADTLRESYWLADPRAVELLCRRAPDAIEDLVRYGAQFAREDDGRLTQRYFGAHRWRRTCFAGDYTGREIQRTLVRRAAEMGIAMRDDVYVTRLLVHEGRVFGAYGFDVEDGSRWVIVADAVVLAAGGHTRIWRRSSSRRDENTGDAMRLAAEAGCRLRDMEFVQFHPTGMVYPEESDGTLVTEAVRGEGGILRNAAGERFMERYDPERLELSTRDRVALANYTEIAEGRGTEHGGVLLDISHLDRELVLRRLPRMYRQFIDLAMLDITSTPMEVAPTAHYSMGGVWVDAETHATTSRGSTRSASARAGCTAPTALAATRWPKPSSSAGSSAPRQHAGPPSSTCRPATMPRSPPPATRSTSCFPAAAKSSRGRSNGRCATSCPSAAAWFAQRSAFVTGWRASTRLPRLHGTLRCAPTSPATTTSRTPSTCRARFLRRGPRSSARSSVARRAAHTTAWTSLSQDPGLQVNLVWAADSTITGEPIPKPSPTVAALACGPDFDVPDRLLE